MLRYYPYWIDESSLPLNGWQKFSTCDFPGRMSTVVFTQGCPIACVFCYNSHLQDILPLGAQGNVEWNEVSSHLLSRQGLLDAFVISGGEPLVHLDGVYGALQIAQGMGFQTGLHTCGIYPQRLKTLVNSDLVTWVGLDIKAKPTAYPQVTGHSANFYRKVVQSLKIIHEAKIEYELRMTVHPSFISRDTLNLLSETGEFIGEHIILQRAQTGGEVTYQWSEKEEEFLSSLDEGCYNFSTSLR